MTKDRYKRLLAKRIREDFKDNKAAAGREFGCSGTFVALVLMGEQKPSKQMLAYTGHKVVSTPDKYLKGV